MSLGSRGISQSEGGVCKLAQSLTPMSSSYVGDRGVLGAGPSLGVCRKSHNCPEKKKRNKKSWFVAFASSCGTDSLAVPDLRLLTGSHPAYSTLENEPLPSGRSRPPRTLRRVPLMSQLLKH